MNIRLEDLPQIFPPCDCGLCTRPALTGPSRRLPDEPHCPPDPTVEVAYLRALLADAQTTTERN